MPHSSPRRVAITGLGVISPLGNRPDLFWDALASGRSGVRPLQTLPADHMPTKYGAEVLDFTGDLADFGPLSKQQKRSIRKAVKLMCREIQMGVAAAQLAMNHAALEPGDYDPRRTGVVFGSDYILTTPAEFVEAIRRCVDEDRRFQFARWAEEGLSSVTPLWLLKYLPNMPACHIAIHNDLRGPNNSLTLREASANLAIGEAYCTIARGSAELLIAGATGTRIHALRTLHAALQEQLASGDGDPARLSRPFDLHRTGMVLGEGAGAIVLEEWEAARARGAPVLGEVVGQGSSTVADRRRVANCYLALRNSLAQTLRTSGFSPADVGHIHAHGLGTQTCDADEARAIHDIFAARAQPVPVVAAKSYFGNLGAGGGAVEFIASLLALGQGRLFPVLNYETPDSQCPIAAVRSSDVPAEQGFINLNVTPQGQASAVAVRAVG